MVELVNAGADVRRVRRYLEQYGGDLVAVFDGLVEEAQEARDATSAFVGGHSPAANALYRSAMGPAHEVYEVWVRVWKS